MAEINRWRWDKALLTYQLGRTDVLAGDLSWIVAHIPGETRTNALKLAFSLWPDPAELLARLRGDNLLLLFGHAARTGKIETALAWWPEIEQVGVDNVRAEVLIFLNSLIHGDRLAQAAAIWRKHFNAESLLYNGDFAQEPSNTAFDWRISAPKGSTWRLETAGDGKGRALHLHFSSTENLGYGHLTQIVPLTPGRKYTLTTQVKSEGLTTDQRPYLEITGFQCSMAAVRSEAVAASQPWTALALPFEIPGDCLAVQVQVRRDPSNRLDNLLGGDLWLQRAGDKENRRDQSCAGGGAVMPAADHYAVLGLGFDASDDEVKRAYRRLSRRYHPDTAGTNGEANTEEFIRITQAYHAIINGEEPTIPARPASPVAPSPPSRKGRKRRRLELRFVLKAALGLALVAGILVAACLVISKMYSRRVMLRALHDGGVAFVPPAARYEVAEEPAALTFAEKLRRERQAEAMAAKKEDSGKKRNDSGENVASTSPAVISTPPLSSRPQGEISNRPWRRLRHNSPLPRPLSHRDLPPIPQYNILFLRHLDLPPLSSRPKGEISCSKHPPQRPTPVTKTRESPQPHHNQPTPPLHDQPPSLRHNLQPLCHRNRRPSLRHNLPFLRHLDLPPLSSRPQGEISRSKHPPQRPTPVTTPQDFPLTLEMTEKGCHLDLPPPSSRPQGEISNRPSPRPLRHRQQHSQPNHPPPRRSCSNASTVSWPPTVKHTGQET